MREWVWVKAPTGERAYLRRQSRSASAQSSRLTCVLEPPLRLQLAPFEALAHAAVVASSPFNHVTQAPAESPFGGVSPGAFWLDGVLGYLLCEEWVGLMLLSRGWYAAMKAASAWARADLGPAVDGLLPSGAHRRRLVYERRAARHKMHKAWEAVCRFSSPGLRWTLNGGLGEGEVRRLEGEMGLALPPYLRASFMTHDGQTYHAHPGLLGGGRLLSLQEVVNEMAQARQEEAQPQGGATGMRPGEGVMLPLSEALRGRQVFCHVLKGTEGEGGVYLVTALHMTKLASSWANYLAEIR